MSFTPAPKTSVLKAIEEGLNSDWALPAPVVEKLLTLCAGVFDSGFSRGTWELRGMPLPHQWVPVADGLPDNRAEVAVIAKDTGIKYVALWDGEVFLTDGWFEPEEISHWMYL
jgi:hypothetical protein